MSNQHDIKAGQDDHDRRLLAIYIAADRILDAIALAPPRRLAVLFALPAQCIDCGASIDVPGKCDYCSLSIDDPMVRLYETDA